MYLDNRLREPGALTMCGQKIDLGRITMPAYIYASREDHIVPWRSAYRTVGLLGGDPTFVLGASGHIAGVINPASKNRRNYWTNELLTDDADDWLARAESRPGSWWQHWAAWLAEYGGCASSGTGKTGQSATSAPGCGTRPLCRGTCRLTLPWTFRAPRPNVPAVRYHNGTTCPRHHARGVAFHH